MQSSDDSALPESWACGRVGCWSQPTFLRLPSCLHVPILLLTSTDSYVRLATERLQPALSLQASQRARDFLAFALTNGNIRLNYVTMDITTFIAWVFRMMILACSHATFLSLPYESACNDRGSRSTKRQ